MSQRVLSFRLEADVSDVQAKIKNIEANLAKALSSSGAGSSAAAKSTDKIAQSVEAAEKRYKSLSSEAMRFSEQGKKGAAAYAQVKTELANTVAEMRRATTNQEEKNKLIEKEIQLREEAAKASKQASSSSSGSLTNKIESSIGGNLGKAGLAGTAIAGGAAAFSKITDAIGEAGQQAKQTSRTMTDLGGSLDKLRESAERSKMAQDKLANNPAVAKAQGLFEEMQSRFFGGIDTVLSAGDDFFSTFGKSDKEKEKVREDKKKERYGATDLIGEDKKQFDRLARDRAEMERDLGREERNMKREMYQETRDLALEQRQLEFDTQRELRDMALERREAELAASREKADIEKGIAREQEDYTLKRQKFDEDFEGKMAAKKFSFDRERSNREFSNKQKDKAEDFAREQSHKKEDFARERKYKTQDFQRSEKYAEEDYNDQLYDMALGGAGAADYARAARDHLKQRRRAKEEFATEQGREQEKFGVDTKREKEKFGIDTKREKRDFANQELDALRQRSFDIETRLNQRRYEAIEIETAHKRAVEDSTIALQRWQENLAITQEKLANKESDLKFSQQMRKEQMTNKAEDLAYSQGTRKEDFAISSYEKRRAQSEAEGEFARGLFDKNGEAFGRMALNKPELEQWLNQEQGRRGEGGFNNSNPYRNYNDPKQQAAINNPTYALPTMPSLPSVPGGSGGFLPQTQTPNLPLPAGASGAGRQGASPQVNISLGGGQFNIPGGISPEFMQGLEDIHSGAQQYTQGKILELTRQMQNSQRSSFNR